MSWNLLWERYFKTPGGKNLIALFLRALRIPFLSVSIIPYFFGAFLVAGKLDYVAFLLGITAVISTHLAANLINDYADSESGADWQDTNYYSFFGGSKLIQEDKLTAHFYFGFAIVFLIIAVAAVVRLACHLQSCSIIMVILFVLTLAISYSYGPLKMSYRGLGEAVIFLLFGPAIVLGAAYIQDQSLLNPRTALLSIPFGFLTAAILVANEVPDAIDDLNAGKHTLVAIIGQRKGYILYGVLVIAAYLSIFIAVALGWLSPGSLFSLCAITVAWNTFQVLKKFYSYKYKLLRSSKLSILHQTLVGIILILSIL